jgi:hypothetical protein
MLAKILAYLGKHKETTMDKAKAMERLDAIENEAQELRKMIDTKLVYDHGKLYVGILNGNPFIMVSSSNNDAFRFHNFNGDNMAAHGYAYGKDTGQECLDYHIAAGFKIYTFNTTKEAFQFFLDNL